MVELCAQLLKIFGEYSVELTVKETSATVGEAQRTKAWKRARRSAEDNLSRGVVFDMTLRPIEMVPIRFVRRGTNPASL